MSTTINREHILKLKKEYPSKTKIRLIHMNDYQAPPTGTIGTVTSVDDIGTIHVSWENGSSLGLIPGEDSFEKI